MQVAGKVEAGAALGDAEGVGQRLGVAAEAASDDGVRLQEVLRVRPAKLVRGVERRPVGDGDEDILQPVALAGVIVDVAGRDVAEAGVLRQPDQTGDPRGVAMGEVVLQLDEDVLRTERRAILGQQVAGVIETAGVDQPGERSVAATSQQDQSPDVLAEDVPVEPRLEPGTGQVGMGDEPREVGVAGRGLGQQRQVRAVGHRQLGAGDWLDAGPARCLGELHRAVQPIVVGQGQRAVAELDPALDQVDRQ